MLMPDVGIELRLSLLLLPDALSQFLLGDARFFLALARIVVAPPAPNSRERLDCHCRFTHRITWGVVKHKRGKLMARLIGGG